MSVQEILAAIDRLPEQERRRVMAELNRQQETDSLSAYDKIKDLIGPGSGLRDVSTGKAYMEGFGERSLS